MTDDTAVRRDDDTDDQASGPLDGLPTKALIGGGLVVVVLIALFSGGGVDEPDDEVGSGAPPAAVDDGAARPTPPSPADGAGQSLPQPAEPQVEQVPEMETGDFADDAEEDDWVELPAAYHDGYINTFVARHYTRGPDDTIFDQWRSVYPLMTDQAAQAKEDDLQAERDAHEIADHAWTSQQMDAAAEVVSINYFGADTEGRYRFAVRYSLTVTSSVREAPFESVHDLNVFLVERDGEMLIDVVEDPT